MADDTPSPSRSAVPAILETDARRDALARLVEGLGAREPFLVVTGEAGTGKTTVVRDAAATWGAAARVAFIANAAMSRTELVEHLARRFGAEPVVGASKPQLLEAFERSIAGICEQGQVPVIVVDDAHDLDAELLGELRLLVNAAVDAGRRLEVILIGSPRLDARLADPSLEVVRQRVAARCVLAPFELHETKRYLNEIVAAGQKEGPGLFPKKACRAIHEASAGSPRAIQTLANEAIRCARRASSPLVTADHVHSAVIALGRTSVAPAAEPVSPAPATAAPPVKPPASRVAEDAGERKAAPEPRRAPEPETPPVPADDDPAVQAWIGNFIRPDEPRFGDLMRGVRPHASAHGAEPALDVTNGVTEEAEAAPPPPPVARSARSGRRPQLPWARPRRTPIHLMLSPATLALAGTVLILGVVGLLVWNPLRRGSASTAPSAQEGIAAGSDATTAASARATRTSKSSRSAADPGQLYALDVGTYLNPERAAAERDRIVAETGLRGWLVHGTDGDESVVRVVVGPYRTEERARWSAETLLDRDLISEAAVVPLPPRRARR